jgi:hypothetical protein
VRGPSESSWLSSEDATTGPSLSRAPARRVRISR